MKYLIFFSTIVFLALATFGNAFFRHKQYYPAVIHLAKSKISIVLGYFFVANLLWALIVSMTLIFFGELRSNEREELWERSKYITSETLLTFAVFKDDLSPQFAFYFAILIYMKVIHWLAEGRIDYLERSPVISKLFHARALSHIIFLGGLDVLFIVSAFPSLRSISPSPLLAFGFEYAILIPSVFLVLLKYVLHAIEIYRETPLQDKTVILIVGQVILDFIKIVLNFSYLAVMLRLHILPAFAFRQIFSTVRSFSLGVNDVLAFRKAVLYMNKYCPSATVDDLRCLDSICIVCREEMVSEAKKLPCNHIFHGSCLRAWFQRQQTCPTCRLKILNSINNNHESANPCQQTPNRPLPVESTQTSHQSHKSTTVNHHNDDDHNHEVQSISSLHYDSCKFLRNQYSQDLLTMERSTRKQLESRIKCLKNMTEMLDTTIVLMQEYCQTNGSSVDVDQDDKQYEVTSSNLNFGQQLDNTRDCCGTNSYTQQVNVEK